ncbi:hypothetical protein E6O75_ATG05051 [Venturia nashicola]|uniref:Uncharacterized protein n=1 Tax=Venturia nashicola TaxID=86259 RepID=A0A4Z1PAD1_9PEZI|nr:hypothetical protein E6O75_ATG05051 [Venturia nashicola]
MVRAVKSRIDDSRDTNSEIMKAETIVIVYKWHSSEDEVTHITFQSHNLEDLPTGSYHGYRPGEKRIYTRFFQWIENLPVSVKTTSEEDNSRMPPALYEQWQNSGEAFGHWIKDRKFIGNKAERVSMKIPFALFDYWHDHGHQDDNEENKVRLYSLYQELHARPATSKMLRPVVKPLAKPDDNPEAYAPGAFRLGIQAYEEDMSIRPGTNRVDSALNNDAASDNPRRWCGFW